MMMSHTEATTDEVIGHVENGVGVVTLNRPGRMNAVTFSSRAILISILRAFDEDPGIGAIVIRGADSRSFSSGQSLDETAAVQLDTIIAWQEDQKRMYDAVRNLTKGCVSVVDGICAGAGFHVALLSDWRIATVRSRWGQPEVKVGLASITGPYMIGMHVGLTHNVQLSLMGDLITGQRAYEMGLVTELAEESALMSTAMERAAKLAAIPRTAMRLTKQRFRAATQSAFDEAVTAGIRAQLECFADGEPHRLMSEFIAKRKK